MANEKVSQPVFPYNFQPNLQTPNLNQFNLQQYQQLTSPLMNINFQASISTHETYVQPLSVLSNTDNAPVSMVIQKSCNSNTIRGLQSSDKNLTDEKNIHFMEKLKEGKYMCSLCQRRFRHHNRLIIHNRIHTGERPYACNICNRRFSDYGNFHRHRWIHSSERRYHCNVCNSSFKQPSGLNNHRRYHCSGPNGRLCPFCQRSFITSSSLRLHVRWSHKLPIATGSSPNETIKPEDLLPVSVQPFRRKTSVAGSKIDTSVTRSKIDTSVTRSKIDTLSALKSSDLETSPDDKQDNLGRRLAFPCPRCPRSFVFQCRLEEHLRSHNDVRPFACQQCDRCFTRQSYLVRHLAVHSSDRNFVCELCQRSYKHYGSLANHRRTHLDRT